MGAENDPYAPYNINEETYDFTFVVRGTYFHEFVGNNEDESIPEIIHDKLRKAIFALGDFDFHESEVSLE